MVCKVGGPAGVEALRRLVKQPPTSDAEARERVASELTEVLTEHAGKDHPEAADFTGVLRRSVLAEAARLVGCPDGDPDLLGCALRNAHSEQVLRELRVHDDGKEGLGSAFYCLGK